ncbi:MAG: GNAT family N-acetyltransferase [Ktedonobacteraceae bacterium]|nr:GNAT family N-acetyltransferase [Ktedonobacteraceae bacterium]
MLFTVRRATVDDVDQLVQLRLALFQATGDLKSDEPSSELIEATQVYFLNHLPSERFIAFIAESEGRIIGTSGLVFLEKPPTDENRAGLEAYIMNMYTIPEWRGKGVATSLMQAIIHFVKTTPAKRLWLRTTEDGKHVYKNSGFVYTSQDMELYI